jgi:hypothetical protein
MANVEVGYGTPDGDTQYTYHEILVRTANGEIANDKFFIGPLPNPGDAVEMVYIGSRHTGEMRFQLRTKR